MKISHNISLKNHHTFRIDCKAVTLLFIESKEDILCFIEKKNDYTPFYILGGGSNVLFTSDFQGTILLMRSKGIEIQEDTEDEIVFNVAAGESWGDFVDYCVQRNYYGIENLAAIPGLVGSSPVQNIGAYGMEVKDTIISVEGYSIGTGEKRVFSNQDCEFGYRSSIFKNELKGQFIISSVTFRLSKKEKYNLTYAGLREMAEKSLEPLSLTAVSKMVVSLRNDKLPDIRVIGSAGSFFKNPVVSDEMARLLREKHPDLVVFPLDNGAMKLAAGQLIEKAGWKGRREGDVGVYHHQALVLVNYGKATGSEIVRFYQKIIADVVLKFGIRLEPEVNIIG
ncbi:MAG: UDP-N-acetylmuramate dehydrogenase [Bacteroidales bacterium]|jgi:UDP-N-acetylmuramate dehydrogenase|nr:UDP-N-acetylmuramate dehydrogenase [Bacteroidales bacterium]